MEVNRYVMDSDDIDYFKNLPSGVRFRPTEEQLINAYLKPKLFNQPLPRNEIIVANIYQYNPKILTEIYKDNGKGEWYFFTPRQRKYPNGDRPNRSIGDGYWKATGADKIIKDTRNNVIGFKKSLVFYKGKAPGGRKSHWIMHEYRVNDAPRRKRTSADDMKLDDNVLCMIHYNNTHKSKTIMGADEDPSTSNLTSAGHTTSHDHHLIDKPVDHHPVDIHYYMLPQQQQQLLQNTSWINDQPKYIAPNKLDHQFTEGNSVVANSLDMATNRPIAANWPDHQFQGGKNMTANSPDNHQFTVGVDSSNYGNQYHNTMIDTSRLYPNDEYQGICTNGTYTLPQQQQRPQQQQLLQNAFWINDQPNYMAPNWPDQFQGGNIMVANSQDLPDNHQFTGGVDSNNYGNQFHTMMLDTNRLYPNDEYQGICMNGTYMLPQQQQQPQQQQLLQNTSWINDQPNYMAPNWPDQFQGGNIMVANSQDLPDNHQFTGGVDSNNYGNQFHTMMLDTNRLYPNDEYQGICMNGTYMLPQQQQQPQQQQLLQNTSWINDQPNYMAPNRPDHKFPGVNIVVANSLDLPNSHQFTGGMDSSNYENIDTSRLYPNDEYQGSCTDISDDLLSMIPNYNPMDDDILNDYLADVQTNGQLLNFSYPWALI